MTLKTTIAATLTVLALAAPALAQDSTETFEMEAMEGMAMAERAGTFEGRSNHVSSGGVELQMTESGGYVVVLGEDFMLDSGPAPHVGLGIDGAYDPETEIGPLEQLAGQQFYALPEGFDPSAYTEVFIWCSAGDVPLAVASLN